MKCFYGEPLEPLRISLVIRNLSNMANALLLKRRIRTAQNVSKTTRAMQMVAASKLKRAQQAVLATRPYVEKLTEIAQDIMQRLDQASRHPYMKSTNATGKTLLLVIAPDKGLCGGLITNLTREYFSFHQDSNYYLIGIGRRIEHAVARSQNQVIASFPFGTILPTVDMVYPLSKMIDEYFLGGKVDNVKVLTTRFESVFNQKPQVSTLLPLSIPESEEKTDNASAFQLFEPGISAILPGLLKRYLEMSLYQYLLESFVSEQAARMIAMQNATDNAKDIIEELTLEYNKARQARITSEILDITSAAIFA